MRTRALALLSVLAMLLPGAALAQGYIPGSNFTLLQGQKFCLNGATCTVIISSPASPAGQVEITSNVANVGGNIAFLLNNATSINGAGTFLFKVQNNGVDYMTFNANGGLGVAAISNTINSASLGFTNTVTDGASAVGFAFGNVSTFSTAGAKILSLQNPSGGANEKFFVDKDGFASGQGFGNYPTTGVAQGLSFSGSNTLLRSGNGAFDVQLGNGGGTTYGTAAAGGFWAAGTESSGNPVPAVHNAQTALAQAIERGSGTATAGGVLAVTFSTAFGAAPFCQCADQNAAPAACGISTAASTTAVSFTIGSARADTVTWFCMGQK